MRVRRAVEEGHVDGAGEMGGEGKGTAASLDPLSSATLGNQQHHLESC